MRIVFALLFAALAAFAEDTPAPKPPAITETAQAAYWRARALASEAKAEQAAAEANLSLTCGAAFFPQIDQAGKISCVAKPADPPKAALP